MPHIDYESPPASQQQIETSEPASKIHQAAPSQLQPASNLFEQFVVVVAIAIVVVAGVN